MKRATQSPQRSEPQAPKELYSIHLKRVTICRLWALCIDYYGSCLGHAKRLRRAWPAIKNSSIHHLRLQGSTLKISQEGSVRAAAGSATMLAMTGTRWCARSGRGGAVIRYGSCLQHPLQGFLCMYVWMYACICKYVMLCNVMYCTVMYSSVMQCNVMSCDVM